VPSKNLVKFGDGYAAVLADLVRENADEVLVVDILLAVGEGDKAIVGLLQLLAG